MRRPWWSALILAAWIVGVAVGAGEHDELERNRRLLERWRADPDHYARLQRDLRAFCALPLLRRQQLRLLDHQLHAADGPTQTRLGAVLERYNAWLEALTDEQRQHLLQAPRRGDAARAHSRPALTRVAATPADEGTRSRTPTAGGSATRPHCDVPLRGAPAARRLAP